MKKVDLKDKRTFYASNSLLEKVRLLRDETILFLGYTDYGGTFLEKVLISYLMDHHNEDIIYEQTDRWHGYNCFVKGQTAKELFELDSIDNIFHKYEKFEDYYFQKEKQEEESFFSDFVECNEKIEIDNKELAKGMLLEQFSGQFKFETFGLDVNEEIINEFLSGNELI